jgi:hypothetical protein
MRDVSALKDLLGKLIRSGDCDTAVEKLMTDQVFSERRAGRLIRPTCRHGNMSRFAGGGAKGSGDA